MNKYILPIFSLILIGCNQTTAQVEKNNEEYYAEYDTQRNLCNDEPIKIAVIDTGFGYEGLGKQAKLCKFGHKNFTSDTDMALGFNTKDPVPLDHHGHGTNIVGIIEKYTKDVNYCIIIIKYYSPHARMAGSGKSTVEAIKYATKLGVDFINYSGGGTEESKPETNAVAEFIDNGGTFVAAIGNEHEDLDASKEFIINKMADAAFSDEPYIEDIDHKLYYPAMDDSRVIKVGGLAKNGNRLPCSNYGNMINRWEVGEMVEGYGLKMSGTSQATAVATGKLVDQIKKPCKTK